LRSEALELLREFFFRDSIARHDIPVLDGPLLPNDRLERSKALPVEIAEPDDLLITTAGDLLVSSGSTIARLRAPRFETVDGVARLPGRAGPLAADRNGVVVGVDGIGVMRVGADGVSSLLFDAADGERVRCPTAIAVADDGSVYVADGSRRHAASEWVWDLMERGAEGRLIRYDPRRGEARVLLSDLSFPAGVALDAAGDSLLLTQAWAHRLDRFSLDGRHLEAIFDNHAGYPGRIHRDPAGGYWLSVFALRTHLVEFVLTQDDFRREMMRTIDPRWWIRPALRSLDSGLEPLQGGAIRKLGITKPWAPPRAYGLVVRLSEQGEPVESLHSRPGGRHHGAVSARRADGDLFVACKGADRILTIGS
jgi:Strictosidine synthase